MADQAGRLSGVAVFVRVRPERNERRWYAVSWGPTLLGDWGVVLTWGRLGSNGRRQKILLFATSQEALAAARTHVERRLRRQYRPV